MEKLFKRAVIDKILPYLQAPEAIVIYGARQVGKTSVLKYLLEHHIRGNSFYFDLEMRDLLQLCERGPSAVMDYLSQSGADTHKRLTLVIDEIQYLADPSGFIKVMHDHYPTVKLLVSGSSTFEIRQKFRESLAGRTVNFEVYPLSFEEFLTFRGKKYSLLPENEPLVNSELIPLAEEFIRCGGYPRVVLEKSEERRKTYLFQVIDAYIRKDIRDLGRIPDISKFNSLVGILASQSGGILNVSEISNTLGMKQSTVSSYMDLLENTFIIKRLHPFHKNLRSELSKSPKVFMLDTGMMHLLWLKEFPKVVLGSSFETFVFSELLKGGFELNYWRTTAKQEVDFIVNARQLYAVEAKHGFGAGSHSGLLAFSSRYKCKPVKVGLTGQKDGKYPWELLKELKAGIQVNDK